MQYWAKNNIKIEEFALNNHNKYAINDNQDIEHSSQIISSAEQPWMILMVMKPPVVFPFF